MLEVYKSINRINPWKVLIFEKCIYKQLINFLESNNLLSSYQYGFRAGSNTELAVILLVDEIRKNMNEGKLTGAIFIDLSNAFDTLSHSQILANLSAVSVQGMKNELFASYLFNRSQAVSFDGSSNELRPVTCGVPQASIIGPLLFLITYDRAGEVLKDCKMLIYADDTVLYTSAKSSAEIQTALADGFGRVADWLETNEKIIVNMKKVKLKVCFLAPNNVSRRTDLK